MNSAVRRSREAYKWFKPEVSYPLPPDRNPPPKARGWPHLARAATRVSPSIERPEQSPKYCPCHEALCTQSALCVHSRCTNSTYTVLTAPPSRPPPLSSPGLVPPLSAVNRSVVLADLAAGGRHRAGCRLLRLLARAEPGHKSGNLVRATHPHHKAAQPCKPHHTETQQGCTCRHSTCAGTSEPSTTCVQCNKVSIQTCSGGSVMTLVCHAADLSLSLIQWSFACGAQRSGVRCSVRKDRRSDYDDAAGDAMRRQAHAYGTNSVFRHFGHVSTGFSSISPHPQCHTEPSSWLSAVLLRGSQKAP